MNKLCEHCGVSDRVSEDSIAKEFLDAAQHAKDHNVNKYYEYLGNHFGKPSSSASFLYDSLLTLPFDFYMTVNLDPQLELKAKRNKCSCVLPPYAYPALDRRNAGKRTIHYLKEGWCIQGWADSAQQILKLAMKADANTCMMAKSLIDHFGRLGYVEYGELLRA
ncbi:MAG: hypothetical protein IT440_02375 [Phycisphaeraceae bacterium]|nr:hypothetical protein [Phycisphaeraceae bacterium]